MLSLALNLGSSACTTPEINPNPPWTRASQPHPDPGPVPDTGLRLVQPLYGRHPISRLQLSYLYELLYFYNAYAEEDNIIPWIGESHTYNTEYTSVEIKKRRGVEWIDGHPWTAEDLKFTIDLFKAHPPGLSFSTDIDTQVEKIEFPDPLTAIFTLKASNPRVVFSYSATAPTSYRNPFGRARILPNFPPLMHYIDQVQDRLRKYPVGTHDSAKTATIMERCDWSRNSEGFWQRDGIRLRVHVMVFPSLFQDFTPALVKRLRRAGFDASFHMVSDESPLQRV